VGETTICIGLLEFGSFWSSLAEQLTIKRMIIVDKMKNKYFLKIRI
jgi:hypothetical protein